MEGLGPLLVVELDCSGEWFLELAVVLQVEDSDQCTIRLLLGRVRPQDDSKEGHVASVKVDLLLVVGLQILNTGVHIKHRVTMVPRYFLYLVLVNLLLDSDLILVRYLAVLSPHRRNRDVGLSWVDLGDKDYLDLVAGAWHILIGLKALASQQPNHLVLAKVRVNVHQDLDLK